MRKLLRALAAGDKTILVSSHLLAEMQGSAAAADRPTRHRAV